jgi:hypothetical protein
MRCSAINDNVIFDASVQGEWINRWNSLRDEGGIIGASQNQAVGTCAWSIQIALGSIRCSRYPGASIINKCQLEASRTEPLTAVPGTDRNTASR